MDVTGGRVARARGRVVLAAVLGLVACTPEPGDPFVPAHETGRLRIGTSFTDGLCRGELDMWEAHLAEIEQTFGVSREPTWLYLYLDDEGEQIAEDCGSEFSTLLGCWRDPVVRATRMAVPHELVHAWLDSVQPRGLPLLREGIAARMSGLVMFTTGDAFVPEEAGPLTLDDLVLDVPSGKYDEVGHFVAWLLETYGVATFMALYVRSNDGMSGDELSTVFLDVLGQTTADVLLAYQTTAYDYYPAMGGSACSRGSSVPWRDGAATWRTAASCADGLVLGFESSDQWQRVVVEVPADGWYRLDVAGREASMTRCLTTPSDEAELRDQPKWWAVKGDWEHAVPMVDFYRPHIAQRTDEWATHDLELLAGTYTVWVRHDPGELPDETSEVGLFKLDL